MTVFVRVPATPAPPCEVVVEPEDPPNQPLPGVVTTPEEVLPLEPLLLAPPLILPIELLLAAVPVNTEPPLAALEELPELTIEIAPEPEVVVEKEPPPPAA